MVLSGAPFIVPQHEHDVDLAIATIIPLIFLTTLLPDISGDPKGKRFQYIMRGLTIVVGFAALVTAFLQLAGKETTEGTISLMALLLITSIFAICAMAWPIVVGIGIVGLRALMILTASSIIVGLLVAGATINTPDRVLFYPDLAILGVGLLGAIELFRHTLAQRKKQRESPEKEGSSD